MLPQDVAFCVALAVYPESFVHYLVFIREILALLPEVECVVKASGMELEADSQAIIFDGYFLTLT